MDGSVDLVARGGLGFVNRLSFEVLRYYNQGTICGAGDSDTQVSHPGTSSYPRRKRQNRVRASQADPQLSSAIHASLTPHF